MQWNKAIHLLYAPTMFCNMSCKYCYLGDLTEERVDTEKVKETLHRALEQLLSRGYLPFNLSFHGGEVTTLPTATLDALFRIAAQHYAAHEQDIRAMGYPINPLHIKTNLLNLEKHYDVLQQHGVSISGSVDLPLSLHEQYRRDKRGQSTLDRIRTNLKMLARYPHNKKISCVVTAAHLQHIDEFIADLKMLHYDIGLDMSRFNVMFGFDSKQNNDKFAERTAGTEMLSDSQQLAFYRKVKAAVIGTPLYDAFKTDWFKEFTPEYCCSAPNCGNKFFLLQANGDVYSCPRGQSSPNYRYGNIYQDDIEAIIARGWQVIERNENSLEIDEKCLRCAYLPYCNIGCTFVRQEVGLSKSYTCELQLEIYRDHPDRYRPLRTEEIEAYSRRLLLRNNIKRLQTPHPKKQSVVTNELFQEENSLANLIRRDETLQHLYADDLFFLRIGGIQYPLQSAILKNERDIEILTPRKEVVLGMREDLFRLACDDAVTNFLMLMLLRDTTVIYGDEQRRKQEHIFEHAVYYNTALASAQHEDRYVLLDIAPILGLHRHAYLEGVTNNLFFTTRALREYHYAKHKKNAFYHLQAINLPFHNIEFVWQP